MNALYTYKMQPMYCPGPHFFTCGRADAAPFQTINIVKTPLVNAT